MAAENLNISSGAGSITGRNLYGGDQVTIDGGVGAISLYEVDFTNSNIDCGVGSLLLDGELYGDNEIDCGVGGVEIKIKGKQEEYNLDIDSGVGTVKLNNQKVSEVQQYSKERNHSIEIDGGVGSVNIDFYE